MQYLKSLIDLFISYIVHLFFWNRLRKEENKYDIKWAIVHSKYFVISNLDKIYVRHKSSKITPIIKCPHYIFIVKYHQNGIKTNEYRNYLTHHFNETDIDKKEDDFIELYKTILLSSNNTNNIEAFSFTRDIFLKRKFILCDGVHRASILKAIGKKNIKVNLVNKIELK